MALNNILNVTKTNHLMSLHFKGLKVVKIMSPNRCSSPSVLTIVGLILWLVLRLSYTI